MCSENWVEAGDLIGMQHEHAVLRTSYKCKYMQVNVKVNLCSENSEYFR